MSLYAEYIEELGLKHMYETEKGFIIYSFLDDGCYLEDVYVAKAFRDQKVAKQLYDEISVIAKEKGCKRLFTSVLTTVKNSTRNLQILLHYGMKLQSVTNNFILLSKELE